MILISFNPFITGIPDSFLNIFQIAVQNSGDNLAVMVKNGFNSVDNRFNALEQGQEEIKLRLDNVAYRFDLNCKNCKEELPF